MALGNLAIIVGGDISGLQSAMLSAQESVATACEQAGLKLEGLSTSIGGISTGAGEAMEGLTTAFTPLANFLSTAVANPFTAAIAVVGGIGVAAFEAGETFETAMNTMERATGASGQALEDMGTTASTLFSDLPVSMGTITSVLDTLEQHLGTTGDDLGTLGTAFVNLGIDTGQSAGELASSASAMSLQWHQAATDIPFDLDQLLTASQNTGVSVQDLINSMTSAGPILLGMGFSFTEAAALLAQFGQDGITTQQTVSGLRTLFQSMSAQDIPNMKEQFMYLVQQIQAAPDPTTAMNEAMEEFGKRGMNMSAAIQAGAGSIDTLVQKMQASAGTVNATAASTQDLSQKWQELKNATEAMLAPIGVQLVAALSGVVDMLKTMNLVATDSTAAWNFLMAAAAVATGNYGLLGTAIGTTSDAATKQAPALGNLSTGLDLMQGGADVTKQAFDALSGSVTANTTATNQGWQSSAQIAAAKKAEADAVKAAAEQTQFETAQDKTANEMLDTRNATIDFFTKAAEGAKLSQEDWKETTVDWGASTQTAYEGSTEQMMGYSNVLDTTGTGLTTFGNFALDAVSAQLQLNDSLASVGVTSEDLTNNKLNDLNNKLVTLNQSYSDGNTSLTDYINGTTATTDKIADLASGIDPLNTVLVTLGQTNIVTANTNTAKWSAALETLVTDVGGVADSMSPTALQLTVDNVNQKLADAAAASDGLGQAYGNLNTKTTTQWAAIEKTNTDSINAIVQATAGAADPNSGTLITAWTNYYSAKLTMDKAQDLSQVAADQSMLDSLKQQESIAIDAGSGTLTGLWSDYYAAITQAETTFSTTVANDLFNGSGSLFSKLGTALTDLGKNIATAFVTDAVDRFVKFVTANLLNGTLFSSLTTAFTNLGTTISGVFSGGITSLQQFMQALTGVSTPGATTPSFSGAAIPGLGGGATTGGGVPINIPTGGTLGAGTGTIPIIGGGTDPIGSATDIGDGGVISIGSDAGSAASSGGGLLSSLGGLAGAISGAISGLVSGVITAVDNTILQHQQDKIFENIQTDTDIMREY
ncbi:MAG: phage tail tape measure protein, partial [Candidatus Sulfotelmatobacter sp.]